MVKQIFSILAIYTALQGCTQVNKEPGANKGLNKDSVKTVLINTDRSWSNLSQKKGFYGSCLDFMTDNSIEMEMGETHLEGKRALENYLAEHADNSFSLEWKPVKAEVAESGELGYTFGKWTMKTRTKKGKDTVMYGNYIAVWHRQADGFWKYIVGGG